MKLQVKENNSAN